jgi:hypothetical protein
LATPVVRAPAGAIDGLGHSQGQKVLLAPEPEERGGTFAGTPQAHEPAGVKFQSTGNAPLASGHLRKKWKVFF